MPDVYHCFYDGKGTHDVFVLGNLLAEDYENFDETKDFDEDHLKSLLECLAQLHGTGKDYLVIGPIFVDSTFVFLWIQKPNQSAQGILKRILLLSTPPTKF
jgi:hypothetical protein